MFAELSTSPASVMSPITNCSVLEFTTNSTQSPVHVMDFTSSDSPKKTAMVVIPKYLLPNLRDNSLASALAKGVSLTSKMETATFSCTEDSSVSLSSVLSDDEGCTSTTTASSSKRRRGIFSPYWKKSGQQPVELIPTGDTDEVEVMRSSAATASLQSWPQREIQALQRRPNKLRVVKSDTALSSPMPPSILRKSKYNSSSACRRHTTTATKSDLEATRNAIAGALATLEAPESPRVKFNTKVDVRLFSTERPMEEKAEPGWSKMFTN